MFYVGIDWAQVTRLHYAILNDNGDKIKVGSFERALDGIDQLAEAVKAIESDFENVQVGIDRKYDIVCETLFSKGLQVFPLSPHRTEAERKAYHPAGDKADGVDALLHANIVRKDCKQLQPYQPPLEADVVLRELLKARNSLVDKKKMFKQELKSVLSSYSPVLGNLVEDLSRNWQKELLWKWPLDQDFLGAHGNELNAFLQNSKLRSSTEKEIRKAKDSRSVRYSPQIAECYRKMIKQKVKLIESLEDEISGIEKNISERSEKHRNKEVMSSLPTDSDQTLAALCMAFDEKEKHRRNCFNYAAYFGVAPVTKSSGKNKTVIMRRAYDDIIHKALLDFADSTRRLKKCWAYDYYRKKRAAGKAHYETLRQLGLKWVKIMHAMWRRQTKYDENYVSARHRQSQKVAA